MRRSPLGLLATVLTLVSLLATGMLAPVSAAPTRDTRRAEPPMDYIAQKRTLSQPRYRDVVTRKVRVKAFDGVDLYLEITKPDPKRYGNGPWPVILEASPYHGTVATRIGDRMFPDPKNGKGEALGLTGYFAPRGYAVAMFDLRGTGRSDGCLDHLGPKDAKDLKKVIEWLASRGWSNGKVGMTGHSYVGSTPSVAAAQAPKGLTTIVPSAGLASMYDHQFQKGVPWLLQWVGPMAAYPYLSTDRHLPPGTPSALGDKTGDNFGNGMQYAGCGWTSSAAISGTGQATGQYEAWHAKRDHRRGATRSEIPVFMIHGVHDNAARIPAASWFFNRRFDRSRDKVWIGQWDHGSTNGRCGNTKDERVTHPTCRFDQMQYAIHAWFDKHLKGMNVDTGPAVEAFLNGRRPLDIREVKDPEKWGTKVFTADAWSRPDVRRMVYPDARNGSLGFSRPKRSGSDSMSSMSAVLAHSTDVIRFESKPLKRDTVMLGKPRLDLYASVNNSQVSHLVVTLYRQNAKGDREPINYCAIQPQLRYGVRVIAPVEPGAEMRLPLSCFTMATWVPAGQSLVMEVSSASPHHATFNHETDVTVYTGPGKTMYGLPVMRDARLFNDVPLRER